MHRTQSTVTRRFLGLILATTLAAAAIVASAGTAGASESSDLSVRQTFAINTAADTLRITEHVSNAGPSDAQYVTFVALFKTTSSPPGFLPSRGLPCQFQTPPRG